MAVLRQTLQRFLDAWNDECRPFTWVEFAAQISDHADPSTFLRGKTPARSAPVLRDWSLERLSGAAGARPEGPGLRPNRAPSPNPGVRRGTYRPVG